MGTAYELHESWADGSHNVGTFSLTELPQAARSAVEADSGAGDWRIPALDDDGNELDDLQLVIVEYQDGLPAFCPDCRQPRDPRTCEDCGTERFVMDCGHYAQPTAIAASQYGLHEHVCKAREGHREARNSGHAV